MSLQLQLIAYLRMCMNKTNYSFDHNELEKHGQIQLYSDIHTIHVHLEPLKKIHRDAYFGPK